MQTCYRHPSRETAVSCSSCGRPICTECMTSTPVGMRCPECSAQKTKVRTMRDVHGEPNATRVIIAINVISFLGVMAGGDAFIDRFSVVGAQFYPELGGRVGVDQGEFWRLLTGGFLHAQPPFGFIHIGFNMYLLWLLGNMLEPLLGSVRFTAVYLASLLAGSAGAVILDPFQPAVGASGAVFGLMGFALIELRRRGVNPFQTEIGGLVLLNVGLTFVLGFVSIGGHIGGLIGGVLCGLAVTLAHRFKARMSDVVAVAGCALVALVAIAAAIARANGAV